jgi:hypothetical protein
LDALSPSIIDISLKFSLILEERPSIHPCVVIICVSLYGFNVRMMSRGDLPSHPLILGKDMLAGLL